MGKHAHLDHENIGPYRVVRELGRGGQGVVFLAEDTRLKRKVALKVLNWIGPGAEDLLRRFRREAEVASRLEHPGICAVYDTGSHDGLPWIAMRFVDGRPLSETIHDTEHTTVPIASEFFEFDEEDESEDQLIDKPTGGHQSSTAPNSRRQVGDVLALIEKTARALNVAHEAGIIHRDIKPGNIMVTDEGQPVVVDFGMARDEHSDLASLTQSGDVFGTPAYMSPEQVRGAGHIDRRSDVYSLGVTLFECLTLQRPFYAPVRHDLYNLIADAPIPDPRKINRSLSGDVKIVMETVLAKDPDRRYQSALDFAEELRRLRERKPILAQPVGPLLRLKLWAARKPVLAFWISFATLALVIGTVVSLLFYFDARREKQGYEQIADLRLLDELRDRARFELWPARPEKIKDMRDWLEDARGLRESLPLHREALHELRTRATESIEIAKFADRIAYPKESRQLRDLEEQRLKIESILDRLDELDSDLERELNLEIYLAKQIDVIEETLAPLQEKSRAWEFEDRRDRWRHDQLARLVSGLEGFVADDPDHLTIRNVKDRLAFAESIITRSIDQHRAGWEQICRSVAESDLYGGLRIIPQVGLAPIGLNEAGLAEFVHLQSGSPPEDARGRRKYEVCEETGIVLVLLPGGPVVVGSPLGELGRQGEIEDQRLVTLEPFFIGKHEVTQAQWLRLMATNPATHHPEKWYRDEILAAISTPTTLMHPVDSVSWNDAEEYAFRGDLALPTEAQWEYACRGGSSTAFCWGDDASCLEGRANIADASKLIEDIRQLVLAPWSDGWIFSAPVDFGQPNAFGLIGMHGNVSEWCADHWRGFRALNSIVPTDGTQFGITKTRVWRGGNWLMEPGFSRSALRTAHPRDLRDQFLGFRAARRLESAVD